PYARHLLAEYDRFVDLVEALTAGRSGGLKIAVSTAAGSYVLPALQDQLTDLLPEVQLQIVECLPGPGVRDALLGGDSEPAVLDAQSLGAEVDGATFGLVEHVAVGVHDLLGPDSVPIEWTELHSLPLLLAVSASDVAFPLGGTRPRIVHDGGSPGTL